MIGRDQIRRVAALIGDRHEAESVVLFGSYANGTQTEDSDVDLLVVAEHGGSGSTKAVEILRELGERFPLDIVVRSPKELRQRLAWDDYFLKDIVDHGEVLFETPHS